MSASYRPGFELPADRPPHHGRAAALERHREAREEHLVVMSFGRADASAQLALRDLIARGRFPHSRTIDWREGA